jgi:hypothetical protein
MKKRFSIVFLALLIISFQYTEHIASNDMEIEASITGVSAPKYDTISSEHQNDLVYRDYGTGIRLSNNTVLTIPQLDLNLGDDTADIYAIDLEHKKVTKVCSYQPLRDVSYSPEEEGIYIIVAKISNGDTVDITPEAMIESSYSGECADGFILLQ